MAIPEKGQSSLRKGRVSVVAGDYFVTISTFNRKPVLARDSVAKIVIESALRLDNSGHIKLECCMVMPDHVHLVFVLNQGDLSEVMRLFKGRSSIEINRMENIHGPFWGPQYYEHKIRKDESRDKIARYCYENPKRKKLVERSRDWPYWWCAFEMEL